MIQDTRISTTHFKSVFPYWERHERFSPDPSQSTTSKATVCVSILTQYRNDIWYRRHSFTNHQQEHDQGQKNRRVQADFVSGFHRQKEAKKRDDEDEQAWRDEVDDVELAASTHADGERDVGVRFLTTRVDCLMTLR